MVRRLLFPILLLLVITLFYLNRSYAGIYNGSAYAPLKVPSSEKNFLIHGQGNNKSIKYIALGDSLTAGLGSGDYKMTYPYKVAEYLAENKAMVNYINLGEPGAQTLDVIRDQLPVAISENPDYISLLVGVNDIHNLQSPSEFIKNFKVIVDSLITKTQAKVIIINIPYLGSGQLIKFPFNLLLDLRTRQFNGLIEKTFIGKPVQIIDLYAQTKVIFEQDSKMYSTDLFHPSGEGYILWGRLINANIRP